jgi:hypothetical protein
MDYTSLLGEKSVKDKREWSAHRGESQKESLRGKYRGGHSSSAQEERATFRGGAPKAWDRVSN